MKSQVGPTTDVYALGVLAFRMLFSRTPTAAEIVHADGNWEVKQSDLAGAFSAESGAASSPQALAAITNLLNKTLVVEPDRRAQSVGDLSPELAYLSSVYSPTGEAATFELNRLATELSSLSKPSSRRRFLTVAATLAGAAVLVGAGFIVNSALNASDAGSGDGTSLLSEEDAKIIGVWYSAEALQRTNLETRPWDTSCTFEFYEDHTMLWTQDGKTSRYAWSYDQLVNFDDSGVGTATWEQYIIYGDTAVYGLINFCIYNGYASCKFVFAGEPLENYNSITFERSPRDDGSQKYRLT